MPTNTTFAGGKPPFSGVISIRTASFYKLDPTGRAPIEPIADVVPSVTPFRVAMDMVDQETYTQAYEVTRNVLQDFTDTTPNVHRAPIELSITGTFTAVGPLSPVGQPPTFGFRFDLFRMAQLERMAEERRPIMVVTPRVSLATAFVQGIQRPWAPADGESTLVTISVIEARIIRPDDVVALPDTVNMSAGDVQTTTGGSAGSTQGNPSVSQPAPVAQAAPQFGNVIGAVPP